MSLDTRGFFFLIFFMCLYVCMLCFLIPTEDRRRYLCQQLSNGSMGSKTETKPPNHPSARLIQTSLCPESGFYNDLFLKLGHCTKRGNVPQKGTCGGDVPCLAGYDIRVALPAS